MALQFRAPQEVIDQVVARMKQQGLVHPQAVFNASSEQGLRREIAYRDHDVMEQLERPKHECAIVDGALAFLKARGLVDLTSDYDRHAYEEYCKLIAATFSNPFHPNPGTTVSGVMKRLIYMLTSVRRPAHLIELGSFWGSTLAWFAGPCVGSRPLYQPQRIIGIDMHVKMTDLARTNFAKLPNAQKVELIGEDARTALEHLSSPFDALYLEAKSSGEDGHQVFYLPLLQQIYNKLPVGAWVLAHDVRHPAFRSQMAGYLAFVRDKAHFAESICFDIDWCGLELSIK